MAQLSIRWKLLLSVGTPLLAIFSAVLAVQYGMLHDRAEHRLQQRAKERARVSAFLLDLHFAKAAQLAESTAAVLESREHTPETELYAMLRSNLNRDALVYGSCIGFEPGLYSPDRNLFAPYVFRDGSEMKEIDIGRDSYDYTEPQWKWFGEPRRTEKELWSEPYFDEGAGQIHMCTYSVPFKRGDVFAGVATVDIPLVELQQRVGLSNLSEQKYLILDQAGRYVSHFDNASLIGTMAVAGQFADSDQLQLEALLENARAGRNGVEPITLNAEDHWVSYAPIPSTHWTFIALETATHEMHYVLDALRHAATVMLAGLILMAVVLLFVTYWITGPIRRISSAVRRLAEGDMDARVEGVSSKDEIGAFAVSFNAMVSSLRGYRKLRTQQLKKAGSKDGDSAES